MTPRTAALRIVVGSGIRAGQGADSTAGAAGPARGQSSRGR